MKLGIGLWFDLEMDFFKLEWIQAIWRLSCQSISSCPGQFEIKLEMVTTNQAWYQSICSKLISNQAWSNSSSAQLHAYLYDTPKKSANINTFCSWARHFRAEFAAMLYCITSKLSKGSNFPDIKTIPSFANYSEIEAVLYTGLESPFRPIAQ